MGKKSKGASTTSKTSSGKSRAARARRALRRVNMKIARWEKYQEEGKPSWTAAQEKDGKSRNRSRYNNWDTSGLKRHADTLQAIIDKGRIAKTA